ncbi:MAG: sigma-54-dependent Fis family transcriptional regulator [Tissierellales bacterium]|nr:sigma-54-dependent Fis family transcriptional regulator [Tissierellales bacterium]MBN2827010.1 sigma-54-dependent Fis family transcriptional regulator [Tissierellales bacterium]
MNILLVDDDRDSRRSIKRFLEKIGHHVTECDDGEEALNLYKSIDFPMVITDINMPKMNGIELLRTLKSLPKVDGTEVVLFTGYSNIDTAIEALRLGAYDYLIKPLNVEELAIITERIAEHQFLLRENRVLNQHFDDKLKAVTAEKDEELSRLKKSLAEQLGIQNVGIFSSSMNEIFEMAQKYHTDRSIPVLIQGDTGSGKEIIAKIIHYGNMDDVTPFIDINCAALTTSLFESELFGYEAGSFTGGLTKGQKGKLDLAQGGTLFLDEIAELPLELQSKLLRVIQEKEYFRVGGLKKIKTDVRIICATNVDLEQKVIEGSFRKDLYYRLKVGHLVIPALQNRKKDILPLADMFLQDFTRQKGKKFKHITNDAAKILIEYCWPGNVRELRNVIEWVVFMYDDFEIKPNHLSIITDSKANLINVDGKKEQSEMKTKDFLLPKNSFSLEEYINRIIIEALKMHNGNKTETALYLNISRKSLYSRLNHIRD